MRGYLLKKLTVIRDFPDFQNSMQETGSKSYDLNDILLFQRPKVTSRLEQANEQKFAYQEKLRLEAIKKAK